VKFSIVGFITVVKYIRLSTLVLIKGLFVISFSRFFQRIECITYLPSNQAMVSPFGRTLPFCAASAMVRSSVQPTDMSS